MGRNAGLVAAVGLSVACTEAPAAEPARVEQARPSAAAAPTGSAPAIADGAAPAASTVRAAESAPAATGAPAPSSSAPSRRVAPIRPRADDEKGYATLKELRQVRRSAPADTDEAVARAKRLIRKKRWEHATELLVASERRSESDRFGPLIARALRKNPRFAPEPRPIEADVDVFAIKYLGGGSTITLRFLDEKKKVFGAFKPAQTRKQSDYRSEIAAWRLCPLIRCGFDIPYNEHVKLTRATFDELYSRVEGEKQDRYREAHFDDLTFDESDGDAWLHGVLKEWVPSFTQLPIERTDVWRPWLTIEGEGATPLGELDVPARDAFSKEDTRGSARKLEHLREHLGETSRRELARQISNMLVYDHLITNWDRFSQKKEYYGTNCQLAHGRIVSIDNGASFQTTPHEAVEQRLKLAQRFSRQLVRALRKLDKRRSFRLLFREPTNYDHARFRLFWKQRRGFLAYVDSLIAEHGRSRVLVFD